MKTIRSLLTVVAIGVISSSAAYATPANARPHRLHRSHYVQTDAKPAVARHQRTIPSFSGGCNPGLHVRFGWCPSREFMWNHMWDEGKPLPDNSQYLNR